MTCEFRVVGTFNLTHTVGDVLRWLRDEGHMGTLSSTMPRKGKCTCLELLSSHLLFALFVQLDYNTTIADAQLKGASLLLQ